MAHSTPSQIHVAHPLARSAEIDLGIVFCSLAAIAATLTTGNGAATWRNIVFPPIVMALALVTMRRVVAEIRMFARTAADGRRGASVAGVVVALVAMVVVAPMLLIMPFAFLGALT
jgi:hypothetical protein